MQVSSQTIDDEDAYDASNSDPESESDQEIVGKDIPPVDAPCPEAGAPAPEAPAPAAGAPAPAEVLQDPVRKADQEGGGSSALIHTHIYIYTHVRMHVCMYGWMDVWVDVWMDGCMDVWMHGWMDGRMYICKLQKKHHGCKNVI